MDKIFSQSPDDFARSQHVAMSRLHLWLTGDVHQILAEFYNEASAKLTASAGADGTVPPYATGPINNVIQTAWAGAYRKIKAHFETARREAVLIGFAALPYYHARIFGSKTESRQIAEAGPVVGIEPLAFFQPQLIEVLDATANRVYGDGFRLSDRVWNLDQTSLAGIQRIVADGIASGDSAWRIAPRLEGYLGIGQNCPRWARSRLFGLTKTDIALGDETGLLRGTPCASSGVSYNALRLIRNEVQIAHAAATDAIFARQPWIRAEQVHLSPSHPPIGCRCEDVVNGGDNGDGIYPLGEISLPLHVQCLCYKTGVTMPDREFANQLRGWMHGEQRWPEMDTYANWVQASARTIGDGVALAKMTSQLGLPLINWLSGDAGDIDAVFDAD